MRTRTSPASGAGGTAMSASSSLRSATRVRARMWVSGYRGPSYVPQWAAMQIESHEVTPKPSKSVLERDDFSSNRHPALAYCWSMIFSENRSHFSGSCPNMAVLVGRKPVDRRYAALVVTLATVMASMAATAAAAQDRDAFL